MTWTAEPVTLFRTTPSCAIPDYSKVRSQAKVGYLACIKHMQIPFLTSHNMHLPCWRNENPATKLFSAMQEPNITHVNVHVYLLKTASMPRRGYILDLSSGDNILSSTFLMSLFVCSARVRVRI